MCSLIFIFSGWTQWHSCSGEFTCCISYKTSSGAQVWSLWFAKIKTSFLSFLDWISYIYVTIYCNLYRNQCLHLLAVTSQQFSWMCYVCAILLTLLLRQKYIFSIHAPEWFPNELKAQEEWEYLCWTRDFIRHFPPSLSNIVYLHRPSREGSAHVWVWSSGIAWA